MRVTADSNIYISGLLFGGPPKRFLDLAREGRIDLCISAPLLDEVSRVLSQKFRVTPEDIDETRALISSFTMRVEPVEQLNVVREDSADNRVLECAITSRSEAVVTGDRHLLSIWRYDRIEILKVSEFLARLDEPHR